MAGRVRGLAKRVANRLGMESWPVRAGLRAYSLFLEATAGTTGIVRRVNGETFRVLPRHRQFFVEDYDAPVASFLRQQARPGAVWLNVGANVGVYALQMARWCVPGGRVVAFEPNPASAAVLRRHAELNGLADRIEIVQAAVADRPGRAAFFACATDGMSRLRSPSPLLPAARIREIEVEVTTLDEFCLGRGIRPDWLLMDVEGFEVAALAGGRETIRGVCDRGGAVVEMHPTAWPLADTCRSELTELLNDLGVTPIPLTGQADPLGEHGLVFLRPVR
jgi:FkbM family methyltransferase